MRRTLQLCRVHDTLQITPAMALGVTDHIWSIEELGAAAKKEAPVTDKPASAVSK